MDRSGSELINLFATTFNNLSISSSGKHFLDQLFSVLYLWWTKFKFKSTKDKNTKEDVDKSLKQVNDAIMNFYFPYLHNLTTVSLPKVKSR